MLRQTWPVSGLASAALLMLNVPAPSMAQAGMIPGGSYVNSCKDIVFDAATNLLYATCDFNAPGGLMAKGEPVRSAQGFNVAACIPNSIFNDNGSLYCFTGKPWGTGHAIPEGSYRASCTRSRVMNNVLTAECDDSDDETHFAQLNLNGCKWGGDISNDNGQLKCQSIIGLHTPSVTLGPAPLVTPVAVEPAVVKPMMMTPLAPAIPSPTEDTGGGKKKKKRGGGERG